MAISFCKLCLLIISVFLLFFPSLSHQLMPMNRCFPLEAEALLHFKAAMNDSHGLMELWANGTDCCTDWNGISCDNRTNHVVSIFVETFSAGVISESLCQLRFLKSLWIIGVTGTSVPPCLANLSYIDSLNLPMNYFSGMIPASICSLTRLTVLGLSFNSFSGRIPSCLGNLSHIRSLDLSANNFSGMIPPFVCLLTHLTALDLSLNFFNGSIPSCLGNLAYLTDLNLFDNQLSGTIPASLGNLSLLRKLHLADNQLSGTIPDSLGNLSLLERLSISNNQLNGSLPPSFSRLSSLKSLFSNGNCLNETLSSPPFPSSLVGLSLSLNHNALVSESFFHSLTSLNYLYLSDCVLNISSTWLPPFQLSYLCLVSCIIGGEFPLWISTQYSLQRLELVNASLVGMLPSWLWESNSLLNHLNLSRNHLEGSLHSNTSTWMQLLELDVSGNGFSGCIPSMWSPNISILLLNDNLFSGSIPSSLGNLSDLKMLNLANNNITGMIPASLSNCSSLVVLNLGHNRLEGSLPHELSKLNGLYSLVVHGNKLHGSFPSSVENFTKLQVLDIGNNSFGGEIPAVIGNLSELRVLVMKDNNFTGHIPLQIGQLKHLQILLLSSNHISGSIPHTIVLLEEMAIERRDGFVLSTFYYGTQTEVNFEDVFLSITFDNGHLYKDGLDMTLKGRDQHYPYILSTLTSIDLSNNELEGEVASTFGNLKGLRLLNLSRNNLFGIIPSSLGGMCQLDSLDLSRNYFSGKIPAELESLSFLGSLNLSNNNLSESIPQGRHMTSFGVSSYSGNPNLWGCPLPRNCSWKQLAPPPSVSGNTKRKNSKYPWYEIAFGLSYGAAFGGILSLIMIKLSWRNKYFSKVDAILMILFPWMKNQTI